jgi:hypothetical protein
MSKIPGKVKILILVFLLFGVAGLQYLYLEDSRSLEQVRRVTADLEAYCALKREYPDKKTFSDMLSRHQVSDPKEWFLFTSKDLKRGALQYPMNLPILWAPGEAKISEFIPTIYAFIIKEPCSL